MDARGYGRREATKSTVRRIATGVTVLGLLLAAIGVYGVIDSSSMFGLGLPIITLAFTLCAVGMAVSGRRSTRTRYRPDPWGLPEWCVVASGAIALTTMLVARALDVSGTVVSFQPLAVPALPLLPVVGILVAATPAFVIPAPRLGTARAKPEVEAVAA
jgi:energy-coupling factor transport system permease protein